MSEYELSLMRQRGLAARDTKAGRGELRFTLPPGFCWSEDGRVELDPDERVREVIRLLFEKFRELGSARQVFLWAREAALSLPVAERNCAVRRIAWRAPAYHSLVQVLHNPIYAGAYAFGRSTKRTRIVDGRAVTTEGHQKAMADWNVLIRDHHEGYIPWERFAENQRMLLENAHMKQRAARKSGRGGRTLLTGLTRCGHCGRMMRVFYGMRSGHAHRDQCRGDDGHVGAGLCLGIGGVRVDRALSRQIMEAISERAVEAAMLAADRANAAVEDVRRAVERELEEARYDASLAARRYEHVDPAKRHVARELEARWNAALERVVALERRGGPLKKQTAARPKIAPGGILRLRPHPPDRRERRWGGRPDQAAPPWGGGGGGRDQPRRARQRRGAPGPRGRGGAPGGGGRAGQARGLSRRSKPECGRGHPQARWPMVGPRSRGHHEPDALQDDRRRDLDDRTRPSPSRAPWRRRFRPRGGGWNDQRRCHRASARHLRLLGAPADPRGRSPSDAAHAFSTVAGVGLRLRHRGAEDRPAGDHRPPANPSPSKD